MIVTDGITDQLGGPMPHKSFGYRRLESILQDHVHLSAELIVHAIRRDFAAWQGELARRDDVTVLVFKL